VQAYLARWVLGMPSAFDRTQGKERLMPWRRTNRLEEEQVEQEPWTGETWEYLVEDGNPVAPYLEERCLALGQEGWGLVAVVPISCPALSSGGRTAAVQLFFRRRLP
jgi:hypothetical protein